MKKKPRLGGESHSHYPQRIKYPRINLTKNLKELQ